MERVLAGLNTELESLVEKARQSLVRVGTPHGGGGAGVVLHRRGLIVTNAHVVWSRHLEIGLVHLYTFINCKDRASEFNTSS